MYHKSAQGNSLFSKLIQRCLNIIEVNRVTVDSLKTIIVISLMSV